MLDIILTGGMLISLGLGGYGIWLAMQAGKALDSHEAWQRTAADKLQEHAHKVADLQTILTAAPPDMINASIMAGEWKRAMESLPEGSPRRQAFAERLKQLGAS